MAVRHVKEYFEQVANQYHDLLNEIRDFEEESKKGIMEPERLERIKQDIQPHLDNYQRWSYMMFLLNKPNKKSKEKSYEKRNKKFLSTIEAKNTVEGTMRESAECINKVRNITKGK